MAEPVSTAAGTEHVIDRLVGWLHLTGHHQQPSSGRAPAPAAGAVQNFWHETTAGPGRLIEQRRDNRCVVCIGTPYCSSHSSDSVATRLSALQGEDELSLQELAGEFVIASYDGLSHSLTLATDHFGTRPLYYLIAKDRFFFGTDLDWLGQQIPGPRRLNQQALYDYFFFSVVPGNRCIYEGVNKVPPGAVLKWCDGKVHISRYWDPDFLKDRNNHGIAELGVQTLEAISGAVNQVTQQPGIGAFLSGGLDSTTVCGFAARHRAEPLRAFTMGFDVPAYDETGYARIAAKHFRLNLLTRVIRAEDVLGALDRTFGGFDEPFGNPSAVTAYLCAQLARREGVVHMLAGDGGDEFFAGNERYQTQALFNLYGELPPLVRSTIVNPLAALSARLPHPMSRLAGYVRHAQVPLPDRLFSYNLLVRNHPGEVLTPEFLAGIDPESPLEYARSLFCAPHDGDALDRMLYLDWTLTLTDNDLQKVRAACDLAGVNVHFPMLDPNVVRMSTLIPSSEKLTLRELRKFYKNAFAAFLPVETIRKSKHGFGVPVGIWTRQNAELRERISTGLHAISRRGLVRPSIIETLLKLHASDHAVYYGALMWPLFALEEWLQRRGF